MKKIKLYLLCTMIVFFPLLQGCEDDASESGSGVQFEKIASTSEESGGTITIPIRGGSVSGVELQFDGTATEGEDFEVVDITSDGLEIQILDDDDYEDVEYVRIRMVGSGVGGNAFTTVNILCDGGDGDGWAIADFAGVYDALEDYGAGTYGPYSITLVQDGVNPNRFNFNDFYDSGCNAYMDFNLANGTVYFPNQSPCGVPLTNSSGTFDLCDQTLTINLNFDGGDWIYRFTRH